MIETILIFIISFTVTLLTTPYFIRKFKQIGLVSRDVNKPNKPLLPEVGGISIMFGLIFGLFAIILFSEKNRFEMFAVLSTVLLMGVIGLLDGVFGYLGYKGNSTRLSKNWKRGISQLQHIILPLIASIPLIVAAAGDYNMSIPFIGSVNFGILYPLIIIPAFVTVFGNAFNMLAGMNGLEAGSGLVVSLGLLIAGILTFNQNVIFLSTILIGTLFAFLIYNFYPAKIFPGDITPYLIGAMVASTAIVGNIERFAVIAIGLYYVEFLLKVRSRFKAQSFGIPKSDGSLHSPYPKIYSLTHLLMKLSGERLKEKQIVTILVLLQAIPVIIAILSINV